MADIYQQIFDEVTLALHEKLEIEKIVLGFGEWNELLLQWVKAFPRKQIPSPTEYRFLDYPVDVRDNCQGVKILTKYKPDLKTSHGRFVYYVEKFWARLTPTSIGLAQFRYVDEEMFSRDIPPLELISYRTIEFICHGDGWRLSLPSMSGSITKEYWDDHKQEILERLFVCQQ